MRLITFLFLILSAGLVFMGCNSNASADTAQKATETVAAKQTPPAATKPEPQKFELAEMPWVDLGNVEAMVAKAPKKIIVDVYTSWCGPCKLMDKNTFSNKGIVNMVEKNFYPVKFNAEGGDQIKFKGKVHTNPNFDPAKANKRNSKHQLANFFNVRGYPTLVVLNEKMEIIDKIVGYKTPEQLRDALQKHVAG